MVCPQCGKEMMHGYLKAHGFICWQEEKKTPLLPNGNEIVLDRGVFKTPKLETLHCAECRLLLSKYTQTKEI